MPEKIKFVGRTDGSNPHAERLRALALHRGGVDEADTSAADVTETIHLLQSYKAADNTIQLAALATAGTDPTITVELWFHPHNAPAAFDDKWFLAMAAEEIEGDGFLEINGLSLGQYRVVVTAVGGTADPEYNIYAGWTDHFTPLLQERPL